MTRKRKDEITKGRVYKRRRRDPKDTSQWLYSKHWWIEFYHHRKIRRPTHTEDYGAAVRRLNEELQLAAAGKILPLQAEKMKFADLMKLVTSDYELNERRSIDRVKGGIFHLQRYFGTYRPSDIDFSAIGEFVKYRKNIDGSANATIKYEISILKRGYRLASEVLGRMPRFPSINTANVRKGFFEDADFKIFLSYFDDDLKPLLEFAHLTGWRLRSEILPLEWAQVDFIAGEVRLEPGTTKTDEGRTFPFSLLPELEQLLLRQKERTDRMRKELRMTIPTVFHRKGVPVLSIRKAWASAIESCPTLKGKIPHDLRRTAVRRLERAGVPRSVAMKLIGHKTEAMYRRYAIVGKNDLVDGVKRLADYQSSLVSEKPKVVSIQQEAKMAESTG